MLSSLKGFASKANYFDEKSYQEFWVSNPSKDGSDSLFPAVVEIDEDAREEYWSQIRQDPSKVHLTSYQSTGKSKKQRESVENAVCRHDIDRRFRAP